MDTQYYHTIAVVHGCLAAIHFLYLVWMIGWSLQKRRLVFAVFSVFARSGTSTHALNGQTGNISRLYNAALSKTGVLGVDGPYFDLVLLFREIVETALQTQQAYRMSVLLPRTELNRGYSAMLVINCWSTALVHSVFRVDATRRRLLAVVCDCALDLVTSVGITTVLLSIYYPDFDVALTGFPPHKWYEDVWNIHVISEFQIMLVSSWGDLTLRVVFALSMISNMNNMKKLLSMKMPRRQKPKINHQVTVVLPLNPAPSDVTDSRTQSKLDIVLASESRVTQILFFMWGTAILVAHLYAESIPGLPQCKMQVKPWITSKPSCSLLVLDCYESTICGKASEFITQWGDFDRKTTRRVVIRHCPQLEVPDLLAEFSRLTVLKFYNSTITSWNESAALSQLYHPNLTTLYLVRVNMTNGELPAGLLGDDFPQALADIEFCTTNLRSLPDDFDLKWPQLSSIYLENCEFTEVPASLARLAPQDLSLAMNRISTLPSSLFEGHVGYLHVGSTLISELPALSDAFSSLVLRVDNTNVSFFWDWIDPIATGSGPSTSVIYPILATNSPYCSDLERIYGGEQTKFSAPWRDGQSRILSNASVENWPILQSTVSCNPWPRTWYPLDFEDAYSGIKNE
ncbi:Centrosomal protein of 41 kDa [Phytophthora pseudosyringae]|uniref:Centrosomal protein of 41 kDa n=1 Tax=Phytophthora pseudosyringae TaxID=221518 RepID=A0A8T1VGU7_9STRA|nr:Centrosomal protein of 41 kDa [Phytophthora pseudosyringae]